ncbi:glycosyltransferase family 4 protein [Arthrobacter sp. PGP41]|uniref:glycosyltransferase n=1 Tax=Arthrobacter sp. PGP41 TaxID=2079227 RepID=UPI000CDBE9E8|nr:glycosyltransferase [Arthrobacter sp. PGP41]AUZ35695.1 glycosyltransferase family 4 protein [Arthrobacter sp. PGP41]
MPGLIVHEWIEQYGGAEKVAEEFAMIFPDATIACLWDDYPKRFAQRSVIESWLSKTPLRRRKALALPFTLPTWRSLKIPERPDWMLCSSHLFAHHAKLSGAGKQVPKYVYAYTPARYVWNPELDDRGNSRAARAISKPLQTIDRARAQEATSIAAVSHYVRERIQNAWLRDCEVIHPPVDVEYYSSSKIALLTPVEGDLLESLPETFVLGASRFVPYKRLDGAIAFGEANQIPVVLAGSGPQESALRELAESATVPVRFVVRPSQPLLRELYARAWAFIFPAVEDFGIMPLEANATGTPVIASTVGGTAESVRHGVSGLLLESFSRSEMRAAASALEAITFENCRKQTERFDRHVFHSEIKSWVTSHGTTL